MCIRDRAESYSNHPIAKSILATYGKPIDQKQFSDFEEISGPVSYTHLDVYKRQDLGLPDRDGLELIRTVRQKYMTPIVVLSARTTEQDKIDVSKRQG